MADVSVVVGSGDCSHDGWVIEFLGVVDFVATGVAGGMEVADVADVGSQCANDVALPYLHAYKVIDTIDVPLLQSPKTIEVPFPKPMYWFQVRSQRFLQENSKRCREKLLCRK